MRKLIFLAVVAIVLCRCGSGDQTKTAFSDTTFYFGGEFVYFADAASFADCATGMSFPVINSGDYLDAERGYSAVVPESMQPVYVTFLGHVANRDPMEEGPRQGVVIDSLIGFDVVRGCDPQSIVVGLYESAEQGEKMNVQFAGDYTFIKRVFMKKGKECDDIFTGVWMRLSEDRIVLMYKLLNGAETTGYDEILLDYQTQTLTEGTYIYKRVYI